MAEWQSRGMKTVCAFLLALFFGSLTTAAQTQQANLKGTHMLSTDDQTQIVAVLDAFSDAWAKRDMAAFSALLTEDCDWVNIVGMHWHGREEVTEMHHVLLEGRYKGVNIHTLSHEESEIAPGVALAVVKSQLDDFTTPDGHRVTGLQNMGLVVLVKRDGKWLIRASENSSIDPRASMKPPAKD